MPIEKIEVVIKLKRIQDLGETLELIKNLKKENPYTIFLIEVQE